MGINLVENDYDVINLALIELGVENSIISASSEEPAFEKQYPFCRDELLMDYEWDFATEYAELEIADWVTDTAYSIDDIVKEDDTVYRCKEAHTSGTFATDLTAEKWEAFPLHRFSYAFNLPSNCLKVTRINETELTSSDAHYEIKRNLLLTDESSIEIEYIKQVTDVTKFSTLFAKCLSLSLAVTCGESKNNDSNHIARLEKRLAFKLENVKRIESQQGRIEQITDSSWILVR